MSVRFSSRFRREESLTASRKSGRAASTGRRLVPREHGAYAELLLPLATGLALGSPSAASWLLSLAATLAFLAHEPLLVLRGARGIRIQQEEHGRARLRALWLFTGALLAGAAAVAFASPAARWAMLAPIAPAACYALLLRRGYAKSLARDLLASTTFAWLVMPLGLSAGAELRITLAGAAVWSITFLVQTLLVRGLVAAGKPGAVRPLRATFLASAIALILAVGLATASRIPGAAALAVLPATLPALALSVRPVHARHLRRVGWTLAVADTLVLVILLETLTPGR